MEPVIIQILAEQLAWAMWSAYIASTKEGEQAAGQVEGGEGGVRAGDVVKHLPSGETWMVAGAYENGDILCAGWPCSLARKGDYEITHRATDAEHLDMLHKCAAMRPDSGYDPRKSLAMDVLAKMKPREGRRDEGGGVNGG